MTDLVLILFSVCIGFACLLYICNAYREHRQGHQQGIAPGEDVVDGTPYRIGFVTLGFPVGRVVDATANTTNTAPGGTTNTAPGGTVYSI